MKTRHGLVALILCALLCAFLPSCKRHKTSTLEALDTIDRRSGVPMVQPIERDLPQIKERRTLTVLAPYNSTTYFIYRGEPFGYEYELLQTFAREHELDLKMVVVTDPKSLYALLNNGEGDIAAGRLVPSPEDESNVSYWLLQKSTQQYSTDPVVKFGFCRGIEPVNYVGFILDRFDRYRQFIEVASRHTMVLNSDGKKSG